MPYQSFDDRPGGSKSKQKLELIELPQDLSGKRVLDLGCNEGFFCFEAKRRGAAYVLGVDRDAKAIEAARERAARESIDVEFVVSDFLAVSQGNFDVVLLLSALHYAANPKAVLHHILDLLSPDGMLILECGVTMRQGRRLARVLRSIDERYFPSLDLLQDEWLEPYSVRPIGKSVAQEGDPIRRQVFHCVRRKPILVFIHGRGSTGKTTIARQFSNAVIIETDPIAAPRRNENRAALTAEQKIMDKALAANRNNIGLAWKSARSNPDVVRYFAGVVRSMINVSSAAKLIVVEGVIVRDLAPHIIPRLKNKFVIWSLSRGGPDRHRKPATASPEAGVKRTRFVDRLRSRLRPD